MSEMLLERHKKKSFLHRIVTGDEKWIHYYNLKHKKSYVKLCQPAKSTAKPNIHGAKVMLCIWWDQKGVLYYGLLKSSELINGERPMLGSFTPPTLWYSPDLAPSDYHLFRSMQNALTVIRFTSEQGIKNWLD